MANPASLPDGLLASFVRWHAHQTEKTTKHVSEGPGQPRGVAHATELRKYVEELKRRADPRFGEIERWASEILNMYDKWRSTRGFINRTEPGPPLEGSLPTADQVEALLRRRASTRFWLPKEVDKQTVRRLIEAGLQAPSSCSRMGWLFVAVRQPPLPDPRPATNNADLLRNAPLIVYLACHDAFYPERFAPALDVGAAAQSILLAGESMGLRGCAMYHSESFDQKDLRRRLEIPDSAYIYLAICMGYPADDPVKPARPGLEACYKLIDRRVHP